MAAQDDASPWEIVSHPTLDVHGTAPITPFLPGRGYFSRLGTVRRKPGRADAPPTLSKSCSDKLAFRQCTTLLSGLTSLLVAPCPGLYLRSVILPAAQYSASGCQRCFSADTAVGRLAPLIDHTWTGGYAFTPFTVRTTHIEFSYSKRSPNLSSSPTTSSNMAVAWTVNGLNECLVNGVLRGRKAFDPAGASGVSRCQMWTLAQQVTEGLVRNNLGESVLCESLEQVFKASNYGDVKRASLLSAREFVKVDVKRLALQGWTRNENDRDWALNIG